ncbi:hypothetical protein AAG906_036829 [Vitis piasezkii]
MAPSSQLIVHSCLSYDYDCHQGRLIISLNKTIKAFILAPNRLGPSTPFGIKEEGNLDLFRQTELILVRWIILALATQVAPDPLLDTDGKSSIRNSKRYQTVSIDVYAGEPQKGVIRVSTDHNIKFSASTTCVQSTLWKLEYDESSGQRFIEKYEDDYKLVFCPTVCDFCKPVCGDIGIYIQNGYRRLALSDVPFKVMFKKA